ncbi:MAG TPA: 7TM-DISM domain-containing protein, partial [Turneriella sp.]|nr:7TM-DISM domain-containing protein [Turneriella sp.]
MIRSILIALLFVLNLPLLAQVTERVYDSEKARLESLSGTWQLYCEDGLPSSAEAVTVPHTIHVPGTWRGYSCPQGKLPGTGRHRFHLVISGKMQPYGLALYFPIAGTSMIAYWNGYKIHEAGDVAAGKPGFRTATVPIAFSERNDLVIDVANFDDRYGGLWQVPQIGSVNELRTVRKFRFIMDGFVAGLLAFLALYNLSVYAGIRNRLYLFLGLFALGISLRNLIESERIAHALLGPEYWYVLIRFAHLSLYAGFIFFFAYVKRLFALDRWRWWELVPVSALVAYDLLVLLTPPVFFTEFLNGALVALLTLGVQTLVYTVMAVRRGQRGANILLGGMILLFAASINDVFFNFAFSATIELVPLALLVFVLMNAVGLELMQYRLRKFSAQLDASISERRTSLERLAPGLAQRFVQASSSKSAIFSSREKVPVRFAALFADLRGFTALSESRSP